MPYDIQSDNDDATVKVSAGYSKDLDKPTTSFIIIDKDDKSGHQHVVIDDDGNEIYNGWNKNH